ncbi:hypothetical protein CHELA40_13370 [Chelatococcus asaccharovorans]|nr:hypothetical protein CHELA40_13370 [Chelatococcus asaccharovorans]CAH1678481.1 hypothetical protein CHELA17_62248 [Chelatococcus asaccharovorans]
MDLRARVSAHAGARACNHVPDPLDPPVVGWGVRARRRGLQCRLRTMPRNLRGCAVMVNQL